MTDTVYAQNQQVSNWLILENPVIGDTLYFSRPIVEKNLTLYSSSGKVDSLALFAFLTSKMLRIQRLGMQNESKLYLNYFIELEQLFSDSISVSTKQLSSFSPASDIKNTSNSNSDITSSDDLFGNSNLTKSGSLSRGITVGSNQDASLESGLRLDLSGEIADSVYLIANLTDQSTPIQPDGSTQNLREFDRVYLQVRSPNHAIEMGDIDVQLQESNYAYINRRLQGAQYKTTDFGGKYTFLASVARGVFKSQNFQGQDGFQGPYRLVGLNGEPFIIVIAGTEKVYVDGRALTRGEDQDYVIDYSLGEIVFIPKIILNPRSRITVDFQYLNQDFSRSLIAVESKSDWMFSDKVQFGVSFLKETDSDNTLAQLSLGEDEISILEQAGDDPLKSVTSGVLPYVSSEDSYRVAYEKKDTLQNGEQITYYKVSSNRSNELFDVRFSRISTGLGSYKRLESGSNSVEYEWVGSGFGSYDTLRSLPRPIDHSMIAINTTIKPGYGLTFNSEWAVSSFDENKFSELDDSNNDDHAFKQSVEHVAKTELAQITTNYNFKYNGERFKYFDRPEEIDFSRKWNLNTFSITNQQIHDFSSNWKFSELSKYQIEAGTIHRPDLKGNRLKSDLSLNELNRIGFQLRNEWIQTEDTLNKISGLWSNQAIETFYTFSLGQNVIRPYIRAQYDERNQKRMKSDSLNSLSYGQYSLSTGLEYNLSKVLQSKYELTIRDDASPIGTELIRDSRSVIHLAQIKYNPNTQFNTDNSFTFQQKTITKRFESVPGFVSSDAVYIKSNSRYKSTSESIEAQLYYDVNSQRTSLLQETYIEVGPELGQYIWDDLNDDGVKQIDEFFPEQTPNEGTYLKQFLPSDDLLPSINLMSRIRLQVSPVHFFPKNENGLLKQIANYIDWSGSIDVRENSISSELSDIYLLRLNTFLNDSTTITGRIGFRTEFSLLPRNRFVSMRIGYQSNTGKSRQVYGSEEQKLELYSVDFISKFNRYVNWTNEMSWGIDKRNNTALQTRNYQIESTNYNSNLIINQSREIQYGLEGGVSFKSDRTQLNPVEALVLKTSGNLRLYVGNKIQMSGRLQFRNVQLKGSSTALGQFEITEGAGEGSSWIWSYQATYQNSEWVQSSLNYDGRTVLNFPTIHTVRIVVRALF